MRSQALYVVLSLVSAAAVLADPLPPVEAKVIGLRVAKPLASDLSAALKSAFPEPLAITGEKTSKLPFFGTGLVLEAVIPEGYAAVDPAVGITSLEDDRLTNLRDPAAKATLILPSAQPGKNAPSLARWSIQTPLFPASDAQKLIGRLSIPIYHLPPTHFFTLDARCVKGAVFTSNRIQCQILSRTQVGSANLRPGAPLHSELDTKFSTDKISFETSTPGAGGPLNALAGMRPPLHIDQVKENMRILLAKIEILDSIGGGVLAEILDVDPDANKTMRYSAAIPSSTGNIRFRFSYFEVEKQERLTLHFAAGLGASGHP